MDVWCRGWLDCGPIIVSSQAQTRQSKPALSVITSFHSPEWAESVCAVWKTSAGAASGTKGNLDHVKLDRKTGRLARRDLTGRDGLEGNLPGRVQDRVRARVRTRDREHGIARRRRLRRASPRSRAQAGEGARQRRQGSQTGCPEPASGVHRSAHRLPAVLRSVAETPSHARRAARGSRRAERGAALRRSTAPALRRRRPVPQLRERRRTDRELRHRRQRVEPAPLQPSHRQARRGWLPGCLRRSRRRMHRAVVDGQRPSHLLLAAQLHHPGHGRVRQDRADLRGGGPPCLQCAGSSACGVRGSGQLGQQPEGARLQPGDARHVQRRADGGIAARRCR